MDLTKYKRFFAFGCSFTEFRWPTWADLISREIPESYNYGKSGGGNAFMFYSLMEAHARHNIGPDDLVIIFWTNVTREDRYTNHWLTPGNIYSQPVYSQEFIDKFVTIRGCLIRDAAVIHAAKQSLEHFGCDHAFLSMVPLNDTEDNDDVCDVFKESLAFIKPSIYEIEYNFDWYSRGNAKASYTAPGSKKAYVFDDAHALPNIHLSYVEKTLGIKFSDSTIEYANEQTELLLTPGIISNIDYKFEKTYPKRL